MPFVSNIVRAGLSKQAFDYAKEYNFILPENVWDLEKQGIYGIYQNDNLLYVGKSTNFAKRFLSHMRHIIMNTNEEDKEWKYDMFRLLRETNREKPIEFKIIAEVYDEKALGMIENSLIYMYQPKLNRAGKKWKNYYGEEYNF